MEKFRLNYRGDIKKHIIVKETKHNITFLETHYMVIFDKMVTNEETQRKISTHHSWHDTFDDAKNYFIESCNEKIKSLKKQIDFEEEKIKAMLELNKTNC